MPRETRTITRDDIMPMEAFETIRAEKRQDNVIRKRFRRVALGPHATIIFENWDSMWWQVHEMLRVEKGGDAQIDDELAAYNPMIPDGGELTACLFFEVDDPVKRAAFLGQLGGVEDHIFIQLGDQRVCAMPEGDTPRTNADGKASAVHFLHFPFTPQQVAAWRGGNDTAMVGIDHTAYGHMAMLSGELRRELARDFAM
ncbi:MAG: DUF3501 family protein [Sphingopyxis sp.]